MGYRPYLSCKAFASCFSASFPTRSEACSRKRYSNNCFMLWLPARAGLGTSHDFKLYVCNAVSATCMRCHYDVTKQVKKSIVASKDWYLFFTVKIVVHNNMTGLAILLTDLDHRRFGVSGNMIQEFCKYWKMWRSQSGRTLIVNIPTSNWIISLSTYDETSQAPRITPVTVQLYHQEKHSLRCGLRKSRALQR